MDAVSVEPLLGELEQVWPVLFMVPSSLVRVLT
jgi:hypothetical protein